MAERPDQCCGRQVFRVTQEQQGQIRTEPDRRVGKQCIYSPKIP